MAKKDIILSGIRPTGKLHIGNYLGALKNFVELQSKYECYFFIADLHSLNEAYDPKDKRNQVLECAAEFLAAGIDPKKCTLFLQSALPEHSEMSVLFSNVVPVSYLYRMTQFKDKSQDQGEKSVNSALLYYPVLMAADILLYQPAFIPVGDDQTQHVELARDIAGFFNRKYGLTFREPKPLFTQTPRVMSIVDPTKKMSKSLGPNHCIYLDDSPEVIKDKLARAATDTGDGTSAGAQNLLTLCAIFCPPAVNQRFLRAKSLKQLKYSEVKAELAKGLADYFADFRQRKQALMKNPNKLSALLTSGSKRAQKVSSANLEQAKRAMGIVA